MHHLFNLIILILLIFFSCRQPETEKPYLARVENSYLTIDDAELYIEGDLDSSNIRLTSFLNAWIESQILYKEAIKKGIAESDEIKKHLKEIEKQLIIQRYLDNVIYTDSDEVNDSALYAYHQLHMAEFTQREDAVRINLAAFSDRQTANTFRNSILKGKKWNEVFNNQITNIEEKLQIHINAQVFTQFTIFPPELWKVVQNLSKDDVSFPIIINETYYIVQLLEKFTKGSTANFDLVKDEVRNRVLIEKRRAKYSKLISDLQSKYTIHINKNWK